MRQYKIIDSKGEVLGRVSAKSKRGALIAARKFGFTGKLRAVDAGVGYANPGRKNPTKAQKREKAKKASVKTRVANALAKFLHQANPAMKTSGASITRLKGGGFTIRPIKAVKRGRR
jgi:hypothetical protein